MRKRNCQLIKAYLDYTLSILNYDRNEEINNYILKNYPNAKFIFLLEFIKII